MFTTVEHSLRIKRIRSKAGNITVAELRLIRKRLIDAMTVTFLHSLLDDVGNHKDCNYHRALIRRLGVSDRIISFNYDCLIDTALYRHGVGLWNAQTGYGFPVGNWQHWTPKDASSETALLLKLHGSMHFRVSTTSQKTIMLLNRPYRRLQKSALAIIPPEANKDFGKQFSGLWRRASFALSHANSIILIGYSFPTTDLHAEALFRLSVREKSLRRLIVVNPDPQARRRARGVLHRGLRTDTRILEFDSFEEFHRFGEW